MRIASAAKKNLVNCVEFLATMTAVGQLFGVSSFGLEEIRWWSVALLVQPSPSQHNTKSRVLCAHCVLFWCRRRCHSTTLNREHCVLTQCALLVQPSLLKHNTKSRVLCALLVQQSLSQHNTKSRALCALLVQPSLSEHNTKSRTLCGLLVQPSLSQHNTKSRALCAHLVCSLKCSLPPLGTKPQCLQLITRELLVSTLRTTHVFTITNRMC